MAAASRELVELVDRDPDSPAYGCFSYPYWRSKSVDYANARCQEASYSLALLWKNDYPETDCRDKLELRELAEAGMLFWAGSQHPDGSFDEWYRSEHGFAATAFSTFALSRAFLILQEGLSERSQRTLVRALERAGGWLARHNDLEKINHQAVAAAALFSLAEVLGREEYSAEAARKTGSVLSRQKEEGWFPELGGVDTGYSFLTVEYLACSYLSQPTAELRKGLSRGLEFLSCFVHPDLTTGREYNLCGNSYVSLLAAAIMAEFSPPARGLLREGLRRGNPLRQLAQDDLSRTYHLYNGLRTYDLLKEKPENLTGEVLPLPFLRPPYRRFFPEAGLLSVKTENYYAVAAGHSGGLLKVYPLPPAGHPGVSSCRDAGYSLELKNGKTAGSFRGPHKDYLSWDGAGRLEIGSRFRPGNYFFPCPAARLLLRLFSSIPLGYLAVKKGVDHLRRKKNSSLQLQAVPGKETGGRLKREIFFAEEGVRVVDLITDLPPGDGQGPTVELSRQADGLTVWRAGEWESGLIRAHPGYPRRAVLEKIIIPGPEGIVIEWTPAEKPDKLPVGDGGRAGGKASKGHDAGLGKR
ncbi:MAG: hypothetical protein P9M08_10235 [Candidatus Erginobacter occultus]|nr:hypothetical protein [Candidatus Erginobacter occultus]